MKICDLIPKSYITYCEEVGDSFQADLLYHSTSSFAVKRALATDGMLHCSNNLIQNEIPIMSGNAVREGRADPQDYISCTVSLRRAHDWHEDFVFNYDRAVRIKEYCLDNMFLRSRADIRRVQDGVEELGVHAFPDDREYRMPMFDFARKVCEYPELLGRFHSSKQFRNGNELIYGAEERAESYMKLMLNMYQTVTSQIKFYESNSISVQRDIENAYGIILAFDRSKLRNREHFREENYDRESAIKGSINLKETSVGVITNEKNNLSSSQIADQLPLAKLITSEEIRSAVAEYRGSRKRGRLERLLSGN